MRSIGSNSSRAIELIVMYKSFQRSYRSTQPTDFQRFRSFVSQSGDRDDKIEIICLKERIQASMPPTRINIFRTKITQSQPLRISATPFPLKEYRSCLDSIYCPQIIFLTAKAQRCAHAFVPRRKKRNKTESAEGINKLSIYSLRAGGE
jgi:hypothetical protein